MHFVERQHAFAGAPVMELVRIEGGAGVAAARLVAPWALPVWPLALPASALALPDTFNAAQLSGVTFVQSIAARVASFMWATHETNAPWFAKPAGVLFWAAVDTSAPWVSWGALFSLAPAASGVSISGASFGSSLASSDA